MQPVARISIAVGAVAAVCLILALWMSSRPTRPVAARAGLEQTEAEEVAEREIEDADELPVAINPGYVGIATCAECHAARAREFQETRHFRACLLAEESRADGFSPEHAVHRLRKPGIEFHFTRAGEKLLVRGTARTSADEDRTSYEVGLVYGGNGQRDEQYFAWHGNSLWQLPVAWLHPQSCWGTIQNRIEARDVPANCLDCHNTWVAHVRSTANEFHRDGMLLGVTCERCHGPGQEHVEHHRTHPDAPAAKIVQPATLARDRLVDVCAQCHSNVKPRGAPFSYRPGHPLDEGFLTVHARHVEEEIVGNQAQQLRASKCFAQSDLSCITCHDPHRLQQEADVRNACLQCHTAAGCQEQPRLPEPIRGDCTGCHLPSRVWMVVRFHTAGDQYLPVAPRTDHRIGVYPEATQSVLLQWLRKQTAPEHQAQADRVAKELSEYWLKQAKQRRDDGRLIAAIGAMREALQANDDEATRRQLQAAIKQQAQFEELREQADPRDPQVAIDSLKRALQISPHHAATHARLGSLYAQLGNHDKAVEHLKAVAESDPYDPNGLILLAWMAYIDGDPLGAAELNAQADKIDPRNAKIHFQWGLALLGMEDWSEALTQFHVALELQPRHAGANQGMSEALRQLGRASEAVTHARAALQWSQGQNPSMLLTLGRAYAAAREPAKAQQALLQALVAAQSAQPNLIPAIEEELRRVE